MNPDILNSAMAAAKKILQPDMFLEMIGNVMVVVFIVALSLLLVRMISSLLKKLQFRHLPSPFIQFIQSLLKWLIFIGAFLLVLQQLGIRINSLWAVLSTILAMIAIGFVAVWSVLSNLLCTLILVISQPFRIGDHIEIIDPAMTVGLAGQVKNINLMFTTLDASEGAGEDVAIQIPNNLFFQKILRKKKGRKTHGLEKQVFEERSLLSGEQKTESRQ